MPLYSYRCGCGTEFERWLPLRSYNVPQLHVCGRFGVKQLPQVLVMSDLPSYRSPIDGRWIDGRRQRMEDLKRNGCRPYEEGEREFSNRRRAEAEKKLDAVLDETVEREFEALPLRKKELLTAEVQAGLTPVVGPDPHIRTSAKPIVQPVQP